MGFSRNMRTEKNKVLICVATIVLSLSHTLSFAQLEDFVLLENGNLYRGEMLNGEPTGYGSMIGSTSNVGIGSPISMFYEGNWKDGKRSGFGKNSLSDGRIYEGLWENDSLVADISLIRDPTAQEVRILIGLRSPVSLSDSAAVAGFKEYQAINEAEAAEDRRAKNEAVTTAQEAAKDAVERQKAAQEKEERDRLAAAQLRYNAGDFSGVESCGDLRSNYDQLMGAKIRPDEELKLVSGALYDFSEDILSLRYDDYFYYVDISDSPNWVDEADTAIDDWLTVIGYYEKNLETNLISGAAVKIPMIRAKCISPGIVVNSIF